MDAVAKEQREVADHVKPELPKISTPSGQIHQKLLKTKQQGGGGSSKMKVKLSDGRVGTIDAGDFDPSTMTKVQ
jgi:hypothetical protein